MGSESAMNSITRVLEKHGDEIENAYAQGIPQTMREQITGVVLTNEVHSIRLFWQLQNGSTLEGPSIDIDTLAESYPDCNVGY